MDSSRGFGSHRCHHRPLQTRFPSGSRALALLNRATGDALAGSFYKRHAISPYSLLREWPLTAGEYVVSGSLSSPSRGAFHLSLTVLVHYRSLQVCSLGGWSPPLPTRFHVPRGTQDPSQRLALCALPDSHRLWSGVPTCSPCGQALLLLVLQPQQGRSRAGLGSSRVARHYCGNLT